MFARKTLKQIADHTAEVIDALDEKPAVMGHSTGGLLAQMITGQGATRSRSTTAGVSWREVAQTALDFNKGFA
ncbi:alpha/beta fold hydrolase [Geodermatophilus sp. SYSU D00697]